MVKRHIKGIACVFPDPADEKGTLAPLVAGMPPRAIRRMSRLGVLLNHVLKDMPVRADTTLVYATTFAEAGALENYLDSLPHASPTAFQTSIHPGGVEQALIFNQQPVGAFLPLAGRRNLFMQALQTALTSETPDVVVCGGEERGDWLQAFNLSYAASHAFALHLADNPADSLGEVSWEPDYLAGGDDGDRSPAEIARRLLHREDLLLESPCLGRFMIKWHRHLQ